MTPETPPDLLEREQALQVLQAAIDDARAGQGRCVVISAEAGHGKTSLLAALSRQAGPHPGQALRWLQAGCDALHTPRPLGPLVDLSAALPAALVDAVHAARTYNGLFPALLDWLRRSRPTTVLAIEDLHWADEATLDCLRYLGRRLADAGFMIVVTLRPDELASHAPLRRTLAAIDPSAVRHIDLAPLSPQAVADLARRHGRPPEGLHALTGGHPFYLQQLLAASPGRLPGSLRDAVLGQLDALSPAAHQAAELVACSPGPLELDVLLALQPQALPALTTPAAGTLLQVTPPTVAFRHELARRVVEEAQPPLQRWHNHRSLFAALQAAAAPAATGAPSPRLARRVHHAAAAGLSAEVLALAPQAAADAEAVASYRDAVRLLKLALDHAHGAPPAERARLLDRLALRCYFIQASDESLAARRQAVALKREAGDTLGAAASLAQLAVQLTPDPEALPLARQALDELAGREGSAESAMVHSAMAISLVNAGQSQSALHHARQALRCAQASDQLESRVHSSSIAASVELAVAPSPEAFDRLSHCIDEAMRLGPDRAAIPLVNLCSVALSHGEHARVLDVCERGIRYCADRDLDLVLAHLHVRRALALVELARWPEAWDELQALDRMKSVPTRQLASAAIVRSHLDALMGRGNDTRQWQAHVAVSQQGGADLIPSFVLLAAAQAAWLRQDDAEALRLADAGLQVSDSPWLVGQYRSCQRRAGAALAATATALPPPHAAAEAGQWRLAHDLWQARGCRFHAAVALLDGDEAAWREALAVFVELDAAPAAQALRRRLQARGARGLARGPYGHVKADPLGLTQRERQVAELLCLGLSNPAIAARLHRSEHTVAQHVSSVLSKLGVAQRQHVAERMAQAAGPAPRGVRTDAPR